MEKRNVVTDKTPAETVKIAEVIDSVDMKWVKKRDPVKDDKPAAPKKIR